ncbi:ankyrin repeat [Cedratvirus lausannensis]|uniref:Ankyrin repeat n=1 Tax=Cedratvirus lausannensis TaxID=2023205 RepID=A0A285PWF1_9VIRU|nr:ankyrin repeat [Cedratvirus lausannensis]
MHLLDLPVENLKNICSFLGGYSYPASMVPYLRSCVENPDKKEFMVQVYEREDFAFIYLYNLFPTHDVVERCVSAVVRRENLTILSWLMAKSKNKLLLMIAEQAALCGSYKVLTWAIQQGCPVSQKMVLDVVEFDGIRLYKFLHFLGHRSMESCKLAALHNKLDIVYCFQVEYLLADICYNLALGGHLESLRVLSTRHPLYLAQVMHGAFSGLHKDIILYYRKQCNISSRDYLLSALCAEKTEEEKLDFLDFLDGLVALDYNQIASMAPAKQHMGIIRWCLNKGEITTPIFTAAVCSGTVQDMDYLKSLGYYAPAPSLYFAAMRSGRRENLQWLKDNGSSSLPDDLANYVLDGKIDRSPLPCLEWCHEQGLRFSPFLLEKSVIQGKMQVFHWLLNKVDMSERYFLSRFIAVSIDMCNLEAFTALLTSDYPAQTREKIRQKKTTYSNYLLLEEMEKLLS